MVRSTDAVDAPVLVIGLDLVVLGVNRAFVDAFAVPPEMVIGRPTASLLGGDDADRAVTAEKLRSAEVDTLRLTRTGRDHNGVERTTWVTVRRVRDDDGATIAYVATVTDATALGTEARSVAETERRQRDILDGLPVAAIVDVDGTITDANRVALDLFGMPTVPTLAARITAGDHLPAGERERLGPGSRWTTRRRAAPPPTGAAAGPDPGAGERWVIVRPDGTSRTVERRSVDTAIGGKAACLTAIVDISDVVAAETALVESEQRHRAMLDDLPIAVVVRSDRGVQYANPCALDLFGVPDLEVLSRRFLAREHVPPDERVRLERRLAELSGDEPERSVNRWRILRPDGTERVVEWESIRTIISGETAFVFVVDDVTARVHSEQALAASEAHSRAVFDNVGEGVAVVDIDGRILDANRALATMIGFGEPDLVVGRSLHDLRTVDRSGRRVHDGPVLEALRTGAPVGPIVLGVDTVDGFRWLEGTIVPLASFGKAPHSVLLSVHDVTEQLATVDALAASETRFRNLTSTAPVGIFETDAAGNAIYVNERWCELTGLDPHHAVRHGWNAPLHPADTDRVMAAWDSCVAAGTPFIADFRLERSDGTIVPVHTEARPVRDDTGAVTSWLATATDLSTQAALRTALATSEARFRELAERSPDVIVRIAFDPLRFEYVSPAIVAVTGLTTADLYDDPAVMLAAIHPDDRALIVDVLRAADPPAEVEIRILHVDGSVRTVDVRITPIRQNDVIVGLDAAGRDVTGAAALRDQLDQLAHRDPLTGLLNRRALVGLLRERMHDDEPTSVLFIDLDGFKSVNDSHGHDAGDSVLMVVAVRLRAAVRADDVVARYAGDEFVVATRPAAAAAIAARLVDHLARPVSLADGTEVTIGASIGIATLDRTDPNPIEDLLRRADEGMFQAKRQGKGQIVVR